MNVEVRDERLLDFVDQDAEVEQLATGFDFIEGPMWHHIEQHLIFSDMAGDKMLKWEAAGGVETFRQPSNKTNGNAYDRQGRLISCEHATSRVTRTELDGSITVMATHHDGKELNSPNDVVVRSDGLIYFTDPTFGRMEFYGVPREQEQEFRGVYRLDPGDGELTVLISDFDQPNGLCLSPDESRLFVNDTMRSHIRVFDVDRDGDLSGGPVWAEVTGKGEGAADGMKIDSQGNLGTTGPGGIHFYAPDAISLGVIHMPEVAANFTFGDDDLRSMFITASTSLYRMRVKVPGRTAF